MLLTLCLFLVFVWTQGPEIEAYIVTSPENTYPRGKHGEINVHRSSACVSHIIFLFVLLKSWSQTFHFMGPLYEVYISQVMRYSRACGSYQDFHDRWLLLTRKLLNQGFLLVKLKSSLRTFYGRHHDLVNRFGISVSQLTTDMFHLS